MDQMTAELASSEPRAAEPGVELSVVMPCLNEALTVGRCVDKAARALARMEIRGEIIVADNGSTDGSPEIARRRGARVVHVDRRGYGAALQAGIDAARGRYIIMGDADDSYDFEAIDPFVASLRSGDEMVLGNRFRGGIRPGAMPWLHRYVGNPVLTGILNLFFHTPVGDAHCGLRGFRKDAYQRLGLSSPGMEFASEMVVKACLGGQKVSEVPTVLYPDGRDRRPHLRSFRDGWRHLRLLLLLCPTWLYLIPAGVMMGVGLGIMIWRTAVTGGAGRAGLELHSMLLGTLIVLVAYQTLWLWAYAKVHGWASGLLPARTFPDAIFGLFNLERGLAAGLTLLSLGLGITLWLVVDRHPGEFGSLEIQLVLRRALWGFTALVLGVQTVYGSFFLSMLGMARGLRPSC